MTNDTGMVNISVRIPTAIADQAKRIAAAQARTMQATYARALRSGLALEEEYARVAEEAINEIRIRGGR